MKFVACDQGRATPLPDHEGDLPSVQSRCWVVVHYLLTTDPERREQTFAFIRQLMDGVPYHAGGSSEALDMRGGDVSSSENMLTHSPRIRAGVPILPAVALVVVAAVAVACHRPPADNLLLVTFDTTRADHLSLYGYQHPTSPNIDALAERGAAFRHAFSHVPSTLPAHATMFTGLLPPEHGVRCNGKFQLADAHQTLAEILADAGFDTGAVLGAFPLDRRFGLAQGFEHYDADFSVSALTAERRARSPRTPHSSSPSGGTPRLWLGHDFLDFERGADEVTDLAIDWLKDRRERWFLFAHYFDPHWGYTPAAAFASPYDAEIALADRHLGRLLDAVARSPGRTLIVFTADHGEGLGEHGEPFHNLFLFNSTLHVPLVVVLEGSIPPATELDTQVGHVDLLPTVLDLLGLRPPAGISGRSLATALLSATEPLPRPIYTETLIRKLEVPEGLERRALVDGGHKLVLTQLEGDGRTSQSLELYDLMADPRELNDLAAADPARRDRLAARLAALADRLERDYQPSPFEMDEGARERLRSLGYL